MIIGDSHEKEHFLKSIGASENDPRLATFDIYVQGSTLTLPIKNPTNVISAFAKIENTSLSECDSSIYNFTLDSGHLSGSETDSDFPNNIVCSIYINNGKKLAVIDANGTIFFADFYHNSKPCPEFWKVLEIAKSVEDFILDRMLKSIKSINPVKVIEIQAKTEFDRVKYESDVKEKMEEFVASIKKLNENRINAMKTSYEAQIKQLKKTQEDERIALIPELISIVKSPELAEWVVVDGKLCLNKRIKAKTIKDHGSFYPLEVDVLGKFYVENLSLPIKQKIYDRDVHCSDAYHPNVDSNGYLCLGDLEGKPLLEVIQKLITVVEIINLDSAYSGDPKTDAHAIVYSQPMKDHTEVWEG